MRNHDEQPDADSPNVVIDRYAGTPPPMPAPNRERHEALAAIEREAKALLGARLRSLPRLIAELRALL